MRVHKPLLILNKQENYLEIVFLCKICWLMRLTRSNKQWNNVHIHREYHCYCILASIAWSI